MHKITARNHGHLYNYEQAMTTNNNLKVYMVGYNRCEQFGFYGLTKKLAKFEDPTLPITKIHPSMNIQFIPMIITTISGVLVIFGGIQRN